MTVGTTQVLLVTGIARQHIEAQIALFWSVFWVSAVLWVLVAVSPFSTSRL